MHGTMNMKFPTIHYT